MMCYYSGVCGKLFVLEKMLRHFDSLREKCLVFSWSTQTLDVIEVLCQSRGWRYSRLDGTINPLQRQRLVDDFNNSRGNLIFLCSTRAGGVGLNLQSASKVRELSPVTLISYLDTRDGSRWWCMM